MDKWRYLKIGDVAELKAGKGLAKNNFHDKGIFPVYGANGLLGWSDRCLFESPVVIIGRVGACGEIHRTTGPAWISDNALAAWPKPNVNGRFLYYLLKSRDFSPIVGGTTQPLINQSSIKKLTVPIPSSVEQQAIADILGSLDDKIELNRRMNETLEAMARALFKSWFVDFDPVRTNQQQAAGQTTQADDPRARFAHLFPARFQDSSLGPIPEGWKVQRFTDIADIIGGGTPKKGVAEYWGGDIPWFSVVDAPSDSDVFALDTAGKITQQALDDRTTRLLPEQTTIITARGTVGKVALVGQMMGMNQSCYGLRCKGGDHHIFVYFSTRQLVSLLKQMTHGSVFDTITRNTLHSLNFVRPPDAVLAEFENTVAPFLNRILANLRESHMLAAIRDALLPKLLSGELRVPEAERIASQAASDPEAAAKLINVKPTDEAIRDCD